VVSIVGILQGIEGRRIDEEGASHLVLAAIEGTIVRFRQRGLA
jgi:hypothetical protein